MTRKSSVHAYEWEPGFPFAHHAAAQLVGEYLESFGPKITVDDLVFDGQKRTSVLHRLFTWDDARAAALHRRHEARYLMNHLRINERGTLRAAYQSVRGEKGRAYMHVSKVTGEQIETKGVKELRSWVKRYSGVQKMTPLVMRVSALLPLAEVVKSQARKRA